MRAELARELEALEQRRAALLERFGTFSEAKLRVAPEPNAWSLLYVAEHLMLAERATLSSMTRGGHTRPLAKRWRDPVLKWLIARALDSPLRLPVAGRVITPQGRDGLPEIAMQWAAVRASWRAYLSAIPDDAHDTLVFRHPLGVAMTAHETLIFLRRHLDHHLHQVRRIERSAGFRGSEGERE